MEDYKVSVIIPVYKCNISLLRKQINKLIKQTLKPCEIVLIHTEDGNDISSIIDNDIINYIKITKNEFDHGKTRDMGIQNSLGDYVILMTQDAVIVSDDLISNLLKPFSKPNVAITYARQLPRRKASYSEKYNRYFNYPKYDITKSKSDIHSMGIKTFFCSDVCACYNKKIYNNLGGFDYPIIFNEDMIMAYNAIINDYLICYVADAKVIHSHNYSFVKEFKRNFDLGVSQTDHNYIFDNVSSTKEGKKLVKTLTIKLLLTLRLIELSKFITKCGFRFIGYKLGRKYHKLPQFLINKFSDNITYWDNLKK